MRLRNTATTAEQALNSLIEFESTVKTFPMLHSVSVRLATQSNVIILSINGLDFFGCIDSKLIHQLGSNLWPYRSRVETESIWNRHLHTDLCSLLSNALSHSGSVLRYYEKLGTRWIYGVTSNGFIEMNQMDFRTILSNELIKQGISPSGKISLTPYGEVVESFSVPGQQSQVGLVCKVLYGRNNGYSSYRLNWGRFVLVCSNGLTDFRSVARDRLLHTNSVDVSDFVSGSVSDAYNHLSLVEKQIVDAQNRAVNHFLLDQLMTRLVFARATKDRILTRLDHEFRDTGSNEWSVSQALTYLGQHEKAIPLRVQDDLTRLGSSLLDHTLEHVATAPATIDSSGFYDILR